MNKNFFKGLNNNRYLPIKNNKGCLIILGCNYHTSWQTNKNMRFVLYNIVGGKAELRTRTTNKKFVTDLDTLIFIDSKYNLEKAKQLRPRIFEEL